MTRLERMTAAALAGFAAEAGYCKWGDEDAPHNNLEELAEGAVKLGRMVDEQMAMADASKLIVITASDRFKPAFVWGIDECLQEFNIDYPNVDRRVIEQVLEAYGPCKDTSGEFHGRCELTHTFGLVRRYHFPRPSETE